MDTRTVYTLKVDGDPVVSTCDILDARELEREIADSEIWRGEVQLSMRPKHGVSFAGVWDNGFGTIDLFLSTVMA